MCLALCDIRITKEHVDRFDSSVYGLLKASMDINVGIHTIINKIVVWSGDRLAEFVENTSIQFVGGGLGEDGCCVRWF